MGGPALPGGRGRRRAGHDRGEGHQQEVGEEPEDQGRQDKKAQDTQKASKWHIQLSLELPDNRALDSEITYHQQDLTLTLWSQDADLLDKLAGAKDQLHQRLELEGIHLQDFQSYKGQMPVASAIIKQTLVDIRT